MMFPARRVRRWFFCILAVFTVLFLVLLTTVLRPLKSVPGLADQPGQAVTGLLSKESVSLRLFDDTQHIKIHQTHVAKKASKVVRRSPPANYSVDFTLFDFPPKRKQKQNGCSYYPWEEARGTFFIEADLKKYFTAFGSVYCFTEGVNITIMESGHTRCACVHGWYGKACSIPDVAQFSNLKLINDFEARVNVTPRKIINAFPFNMEFAALEARFAELYDVVDVFLIVESNYTSYGDHKPLLLLESLKKGFYRQYACKIVHVFLDHYPEDGFRNGWAPELLIRDTLSTQGLQHQLINYNHDDIFLLNDADELPTRESILFLKLHDGYPQPIGFRYSGYVYGYFWEGHIKVEQSAVNIGLLMQVLHNKASAIRAMKLPTLVGSADFRTYQQAYGKIKIRPWEMGNNTHRAGWHCSWCGSPEMIQIKLLAAINEDFPRWGDYEDKRQLPYIRTLIKEGMWFTEQLTFPATNTSNPNIAPRHILANKLHYKDLLVNKYA